MASQKPCSATMLSFNINAFHISYQKIAAPTWPYCNFDNIQDDISALKASMIKVEEKCITSENLVVLLVPWFLQKKDKHFLFS